MNCQEFRDRLNKQLDARKPVTTDGPLARHAVNCGTCRLDFSIGVQIQSGDQMLKPCGRDRRRVAGFMVGIAAVIGLVCGYGWYAASPDSSVGPSTSSSELAMNQPAVTDGQMPPLDSVTWSEIHPRTWVGRTMPAVRSVQQSVAPVGRSFLKAVVLLTSGSARGTT